MGRDRNRNRNRAGTGAEHNVRFAVQANEVRRRCNADKKGGARGLKCMHFTDGGL